MENVQSYGAPGGVDFEPVNSLIAFSEMSPASGFSGKTQKMVKGRERKGDEPTHKSSVFSPDPLRETLERRLEPNPVSPIAHQTSNITTAACQRNSGRLCVGFREFTSKQP